LFSSLRNKELRSENHTRRCNKERRKIFRICHEN